MSYFGYTKKVKVQTFSLFWVKSFGSTHEEYGNQMKK